MFSLQWLSAVPVAETLSLRSLLRPSPSTTAEAGVPPQCWESPPCTSTAQGPLEFSSVTPRYPVLTVRTSHAISLSPYAQGRSTIPHRQSCPTEQLEMVRNRPSCRENSKKWSSVMSAFPKGDSRVFKTYWCENSARYRYAKRELAHFMGLEKNWVSQLFGCFSSCFCCTGLVLFLPMLLSAD